MTWNFVCPGRQFWRCEHCSSPHRCLRVRSIPFHTLLHNHYRYYINEIFTFHSRGLTLKRNIPNWSSLCVAFVPAPVAGKQQCGMRTAGGPMFVRVPNVAISHASQLTARKNALPVCASTDRGALSHIAHKGLFSEDATQDAMALW